MLKNNKIFYRVLTVLCWLILIGCGIFLLMYQLGKEKLSDNIAASVTGIVSEEDANAYQSITYQGKEYTYKENLVNILCIGVDKTEAMAERDVDTNSIGQGDVIVLMTVDMESKEISMLSIPRDTVVMLEMYNGNGNYMGQRTGQLTLQYAYGDGEDLSAGLMAKQVSGMLNGVPVNAYVAINIYSLWNLNAAIGGVDVVMDEDYTMYHPSFEKGATVHLEENMLELYLRERDKAESGSATSRMHRVKQYLMAAFEKAKVVLKEDSTLPIRAMNVLEEHMVTDLTTDEVVYLLSEAMKCTFEGENVYSLPGEIVRNGSYEEYYLDQEGVAELIIDLFYESVE